MNPVKPHQPHLGSHHELPFEAERHTPRSPLVDPPKRSKVFLAGSALALLVSLAGGTALYKVAMARGAAGAGPEGWRDGTSQNGAESQRVVRDVPHLEGGAIVFSEAFRKRAGVEMTAVRRAPLTPTFRVVGTATFDPAHVAAVGTRVRGFVRTTLKYEGDEVKAGEALGEIESAEIGQAQADVAMAKAHVAAADINARREKELLERHLTTQREAEVAGVTHATSQSGLEAAQQRVLALGGNTRGQFGVFVLRAPIGGHVVETHISPGQSVEGNLLAYKVADLRWLWIELGIPERSAGDVRLGDTVEISPVGDPSRKIAGRVAHVGEVIDLSTRSTEVRIAVDNAAPDGAEGGHVPHGGPCGHVLRPGQSVFATLSASGGAHEALVIPQSAIAYVDGKATVFVAVGEDRVVPTNIKEGASDSTLVEVLEGLKEGQIVASAGVFPLKSELFR